jgi:hypothetical protein
MAKEESKSVLENAILEYKQILEVAKGKVAESHSKELNDMITKLITENDLSQYKEPEMVQEESLSTEMNTQEPDFSGNNEAINMKEASLKEIEDAFNAAGDDDDFQVVKQDDGQEGNDFSLSDIEGEISEVMSEIEAAENQEGVDAGLEPEEDNLTKIKKIHEEMGNMIAAMENENNEVEMKENFHNKMMETFGEGYENAIGMNECGKMYETFKSKSMNETDASVKAPKTTAISPTVKPVVAENEGAGKSKVPNTFTPKSAATSGTYAAKAMEKPLAGIKESINEDPVNLAAVAAGIAGVIGSGVGVAGLMQMLKTKYPNAYQALSSVGSAAKGSMNQFNGVQENMEMEIAETHGVGLSANKLVGGNQTPSLDHKEYATDKVRLALQKEGVQKQTKKINTLVNENFALIKEANKAKAAVKEMTKINESYREAIDKYRKQLNEMALVSTNIANVNNILVNESLALSFEDKKNIINEFKKVSTVEESEKTHKKIIKEFSEAKKTIKESVENKINSAIESSSSEEVKAGVEGNTLNEHVDKLKKLINYKHKN